MTDEPAKPSAPNVSFVGGNFPTIRVGHTAVWVDGGAFGINLIERRPVPAASAPGTVTLADFEVGRFMLSPVALVQLRRNIDAALALYKTTFGSDPPGPEAMPKDAMDAAKRSLLEGLPTQPPPESESPD